MVGHITHRREHHSHSMDTRDVMDSYGHCTSVLQSRVLRKGRHLLILTGQWPQAWDSEAAGIRLPHVLDNTEDTGPRETEAGVGGQSALQAQL